MAPLNDEELLIFTKNDLYYEAIALDTMTRESRKLGMIEGGELNMQLLYDPTLGPILTRLSYFDDDVFQLLKYDSCDFEPSVIIQRKVTKQRTVQ